MLMARHVVTLVYTRASVVRWTYPRVQPGLAQLYIDATRTRCTQAHTRMRSAIHISCRRFTVHRVFSFHGSLVDSVGCCTLIRKVTTVSHHPGAAFAFIEFNLRQVSRCERKKMKWKYFHLELHTKCILIKFRVAACRMAAKCCAFCIAWAQHAQLPLSLFLSPSQGGIFMHFRVGGHFLWFSPSLSVRQLF